MFKHGDTLLMKRPVYFTSGMKELGFERVGDTLKIDLEGGGMYLDNDGDLRYIGSDSRGTLCVVSEVEDGDVVIKEGGSKSSDSVEGEQDHLARIALALEKMANHLEQKEKL